MGSQEFENKAAWLKVAKSSTLVVDDAPYIEPDVHEIVVKNKAIATNPADCMIQSDDIMPNMTYPALIGCDLAGEVVEVGDNVSRFKVGDRVCAVSQVLGKNNGSFQLYPVVQEAQTIRIPDSLSFEQGAVITLGFRTAASMLYQVLELDLPQLEPVEKRGTILVWGASSSVGNSAVQLAKSSGYQVIGICSPHNFDSVKKLDATHTFDYKSDRLEESLMAVLKGEVLSGAIDAVSQDGFHDTLTSVVQRANGSKKIACAQFIKKEVPSGIEAVWNGVEYKEMPSLIENFLEKALDEGKYLAAPNPKVVGSGLETIQQALDLHRKGVSGEKPVVSL